MLCSLRGGIEFSLTRKSECQPDVDGCSGLESFRLTVFALGGFIVSTFQETAAKVQMCEFVVGRDRGRMLKQRDAVFPVADLRMRDHGENQNHGR